MKGQWRWGWSLLLLLYLAIALLAQMGVLATHWNQQVGDSFLAPSEHYWLGTDIFGRSILAKLLKGCQLAMGVGLSVAFFVIFLGTFLGLWAGFRRGIIDEVLLWICGCISAIPAVMLMCCIMFLWGNSSWSIVGALAYTMWIPIFRLVRAEVIRLGQSEFMLAAKALGGGQWHLLRRHLLPQLFPIMVVQFALTLQTAIKAEVILSFLGMGVEQWPSWGVMLYESRVQLMRGIWWPLLAVSVTIFIFLLGLHCWSDHMRDLLDRRS